MHTAIFSLFQRHELAKAFCFIDQVSPALGVQRWLHLLINDEDSPELRAYSAAASSYIVVHCEGQNLGVAGGRNLLVRRAIAQGAEFLVSCDTDIIYATDYFDRLESAYCKLLATDSQLGTLQPLLLDGRRVREALPALAEALDWDALRTSLHARSDSRRQLWKAVVGALGLDEALSTIYHCGVSNPWRAHFGMPPDPQMQRPWGKLDWKERYGTDAPTLRSEPQALKTAVVSGQPFHIASAAGGVTAFGASFFEAIGGYDDIFNPFGYEDSEFGLRALLAGRTSYLVPDAVAIHDIFLGASNRSLMAGARIGLLRGVEAAQPLLPPPARSFALQQSLFYGWRDLLKPIGDAAQARTIASADVPSMLADFVASYLFDFVRGLLTSIARSGATAPADAFLRLLQGWIQGDCIIPAFELPVGDGAVLAVGNVMTRRRDADHGPVYSLYASNVRVEEHTADTTLVSRHFDLSLVLRPGDGGHWHLNADILSDDHLFGAEAILRCRVADAVGHGSIEVVSGSTRHRQHEYGRFSIEDIYPEPTLHRSNGWLRVVSAYLDHLDKAVRQSAPAGITRALRRYLQLGKPGATGVGAPAVAESAPATPAAASPVQRPRPSTAVAGARPPADGAAGRRRRVLVFTDSRGQHKPAGQDHAIFGERLAADPRFDVDLFLCPMKWTTTLDFLEQFDAAELASYDHVVLYTGIVDWSPRKFANARHEVYDNSAEANVGNLRLNTRDYSRKIVNNKKRIFDATFGADRMAEHFDRPFEIKYEGEPTINMYSLEMAGSMLLPILSSIPNLIFVSANRFVPGWEGDFKRGRPSNIKITEQYSNLFVAEFERAGVKTIDLMK